MSALVFKLKQEPQQRLDLSLLVPHNLAGKNQKQIASIVIGTNREKLRVGDIFNVKPGEADNICFSAGSERFDRVGLGLGAGTITVKGDVGICAGRLMSAGTLVIEGSAGHWAASGLTGGRVSVGGDCGDFLGGPLAGEMAGMRGGHVHIKGSAGARAGDRLRRGVIIVDGKAGPFAGSRMIAGTLIVSGKAGRLPGYLMRRGTIVLGKGAEGYSPTFIECGAGSATILGLMARDFREIGLAPAALKRRNFVRLGGDTAVLGKGEIFSGR